MRTHAVPYDVFDQLAAGDGDTQGVLRAGQRSKRLLLIHEVVRAARRKAPSLVAEGRVDDAFDVLVDTQRRCPHAVDSLLLHPQIGAWATHCLTRLATDDRMAPEDLGHLGAVAAAAALRAGRSFAVPACLRDDGSLMLPTFGLARPALEPGWCELRSRSGAGGIEVATASAVATVSFVPDHAWLPLRRLSASAAGLSLDLDLDDVDPYRGCGILATAGRNSPVDATDWQSNLDDAWATLVRHHTDAAAAIRTGIASVVPLRSTEEDSQLSATVHRAVGAVAMTAPEQPLSMALALVHEFQHTKLSTLLDLVPMVEEGSPGRHYSPWRRDPRPLPGLFQGSYAFLALTRFWNVQRHLPESPSRTAPRNAVADFEFAVGREQVRQGVASLQRAGALLPPGVRFVEGMRRRLTSLASSAVPREVEPLAALALRDHRLSWGLRNVHVDPELVDTWARAWLAGRPSPDRVAPRHTVRHGNGPLPSQARYSLVRRRLGFPARWKDDPGGASQADVLLMAGQEARAQAVYRAQIELDPDDLSSWAGLALTLPMSRPECVYALHQAIRAKSGSAPRPDDLAAWLAD